MFCQECGKELKPGKKFCIYCGEPVPAEFISSDSPQPSEQVVVIPQLQSAINNNSGDDDKTELLIDTEDQQNTGNDENKERLSRAESDGTLLLDFEDKTNGTLVLGLESGESDEKDSKNAAFSGSLENKTIVLKYRDHIIDEAKIKEGNYVQHKENSAGVSTVIKAMIVIVILLIITAVGLGAYYYVDSQQPKDKITAPEINNETDTEEQTE